MKILIGEKSLIILSKDISNPSNYIEFYAGISYFLKQNLKFSSIFGLFLDPYSDLLRKKLRMEFITELNHTNFISLLEGNNLEAYYSYTTKSNDLLGIELALDEKLMISEEEVLLGLIREIKNKTQEIFHKS